MDTRVIGETRTFQRLLDVFHRDVGIDDETGYFHRASADGVFVAYAKAEVAEQIVQMVFNGVEFFQIVFGAEAVDIVLNFDFVFLGQFSKTFGAGDAEERIDGFFGGTGEREFFRFAFRADFAGMMMGDAFVGEDGFIMQDAVDAFVQSLKCGPRGILGRGRWRRFVIGKRGPRFVQLEHCGVIANGVDDSRFIGIESGRIDVVLMENRSNAFEEEAERATRPVFGAKDDVEGEENTEFNVFRFAINARSSRGFLRNFLARPYPEVDRILHSVLF